MNNIVEDQVQKLYNRFQTLGHGFTTNSAWQRHIEGLVAFAYTMGRLDGKKDELSSQTEELKSLLEKMNAEG